ncbi:MAG: virulence RhuM family protein [Spirochaetales bacterium]|nr:virulence RhuM family protein [Spirochaetales bacterium]
MSETYELVKFVDGSFELEVNVSPEEDTVWLTQEQMASLFDVDQSRISRHITAIYRDEELDKEATYAENALVQVEGQRRIKRRIQLYNLDMIIAVGYRVNSKRGTLFRQWANKILKSYMLRGFAVEPSRVLVSRENYLDLVNVVNRIDSTQTDLVGRVERLEDKYPELGMRIFFKGQLYDASSCIEGILEQAHREILLIDGYVDRHTLDMLSGKRDGVKVLLFTSSRGNRITGKEISDFNAQYPSLEVHITEEFHDRFLILDRERMYHIGASVKDAGRRTFEISESSDGMYLEMMLGRLSLPEWDKD